MFSLCLVKSINKIRDILLKNKIIYVKKTNILAYRATKVTVFLF
jgi:hypothetical protein